MAELQAPSPVKQEPAERLKFPKIPTSQRQVKGMAQESAAVEPVQEYPGPAEILRFRAMQMLRQKAEIMVQESAAAVMSAPRSAEPAEM